MNASSDQSTITLHAFYGTNPQGKIHGSTEQIKKRMNCNIQGSVRSQQAREVTDPRRLQISNRIIGTSHILLLQTQKKMKNVLMHCKDPHGGAHTVFHVTHKLRSAEHEITPLSINTISLVFPQIIQILRHLKIQINQDVNALPSYFTSHCSSQIMSQS